MRDNVTIIKDFTNKNVTLKLTLEKAIKKAFNQSQIEKEIKAATNANSVRLLFEYKAETNIRSKEIVNEKSIKEKFKKTKPSKELQKAPKEVKEKLATAFDKKKDKKKRIAIAASLMLGAGAVGVATGVGVHKLSGGNDNTDVEKEAENIVKTYAEERWENKDTLSYGLSQGLDILAEALSGGK